MLSKDTIRNADSKMRTLYKGPLAPPAPGEEFELRRWMWEAMPKEEDRCPGWKQAGTEHTSVSKMKF